MRSNFFTRLYRNQRAGGSNRGARSVIQQRAFADILFAPVASLPDSSCVLMISALDLRQSNRKRGS